MKDALLNRRLGLKLLFLIGAFIFRAPAADPPSFSQANAILQKHCLDCHAVQDPDGSFVLEEYSTLMKGGESGPAVVAGKSGESLLIQMVEGKFVKGGKQKIMPPGKREKLTSEEIATLRAWIDSGAAGPRPGELIVKEIAVPKIAPTVPPRRSVHSLAFEPKSKLLAAGRYGEVEIYSADSQSLIRTLTGPEGKVNAVVFSPDGKFLFASGGPAGIKGEIKQWTVADGSVTRSIPAHNDSIYALAISPDGKWLASGSYDQKIKIWSTESGSEIRTLTGHNGCIYGLSFRPDGKILASASGDRTIKLWDVQTGARLDTLSQPLKEQYSVAFSPDGKRLAAAGVDNRIRVWMISEDARETTNPILHSTFAHEGALLKIAYSEDGKFLASSSEDRSVKLWNSDSIEELRVLEAQPDWAPALAFISKSSALAVGRLDGSIGFYNTENGSVLSPPKPELARLEPRGIQSGKESVLKVMGKNLHAISQVKFRDERIKGTLAADSAHTGEFTVNVTVDSSVPRGTYEFTASSPAGESNALKLYVDDISQFTENEDPKASEALQSLPALPVTVWGSHQISGDVDVYEFTAKKDETMVFDAAAKTIGSKADLVLSLVDDHGRVLASNNRFDKTGDPLIAHAFRKSGRYQLQVSELVLGGSPEHFYRVSIGSFPFVTGLFPPVISKSKPEVVRLIGYNIPPEAHAPEVKKADGAVTSVELDPGKFRWRGDLKLTVSDQPVTLESEANNSPGTASAVAVPGMVAGRLASEEKEDWFKFTAKAGQTLVLETAAERIASPLDTKLEIRDTQGEPVLRTLLQAVRASAITFRGIDSSTVDCRVENWEEMELNQYLYLQGEVVRLFRAPQGPDSGFNFYPLQGKRRNYFDTTATAHADAEPCFIIEPRPADAKIVSNGLPTFPIFFENDDDAERKLGTDSKVLFSPPTDGEYRVRVTDTRGFNGDRYVYTLTIREARPDFKVTLDGMNPKIARGSGQRFVLNADRMDGFEGDIKVQVSGVPTGFTISNPITIQAGHTTAFGTLYAHSDAPEIDTNSWISFSATAEINGKNIQHDAGKLGKVTLTDSAPLYVELEPSDNKMEITVAPGSSVPARIKVRRNGHNELITFQVENLPHGIIVDNIGLNGVLIPKDLSERDIFITAAKWVPETERLCYAVSNEAGRQTSRPVLIKVRSSVSQVAKN